MRFEEWELFPGYFFRQLVGRAYGHPRLPDGKRVMVQCVGAKDGKLVDHNGEEWEIGHAHPEYEAVFPGAQARLQESLFEQEKRENSLSDAAQEGLRILDGGYEG